jgi:quercetin dioxygenase-like cupin family protein
VDAVVLRPGEGERLARHIVLRVELPEISVNEVAVGPQFEGADPHFHREHVDVFHVLEGQLELLNGTEEVVAPAGTSVAIPPGVVHAFRSDGGARYLNVHASDGGFIQFLRARRDGGDFEWDSVSVDGPSGPAEAILTGAGDGERIARSSGVANTIRAVTPQISLFELEFDERWEGVDPHLHDDHVDSFYVLDGQVDFQFDDDSVCAGAGTFFSAPIGVTHGFRPAGPARVFNMHAPDAGFADRVRAR